MKKKFVSTILIISILSTGLLSGCGKSASAESVDLTSVSFAASFIGHYNVFSPDEFKQAFHVAAPDNKMTAIRPETIQISTEKPQENDAIHTIYGKIINNRSVGNTLHYHIDVNGITFKVDTLFRSFALYKNDQNVWLSLEKRNCLALED